MKELFLDLLFATKHYTFCNNNLITTSDNNYGTTKCMMNIHEICIFTIMMRRLFTIDFYLELKFILFDEEFRMMSPLCICTQKNQIARKLTSFDKQLQVRRMEQLIFEAIEENPYINQNQLARQIRVSRLSIFCIICAN